MLGGIILFLWTTEATTTPLTMTKFNGIWEVFGGIEVDGYGQAILETLVIKNGRVKSNIYCTNKATFCSLKHFEIKNFYFK